MQDWLVDQKKGKMVGGHFQYSCHQYTYHPVTNADGSWRDDLPLANCLFSSNYNELCVQGVINLLTRAQFIRKKIHRHGILSSSGLGLYIWFPVRSPEA